MQRKKKTKKQIDEQVDRILSVPDPIPDEINEVPTVEEKSEEEKKELPVGLCDSCKFDPNTCDMTDHNITTESTEDGGFKVLKCDKHEEPIADNSSSPLVAVGHETIEIEESFNEAELTELRKSFASIHLQIASLEEEFDEEKADHKARLNPLEIEADQLLQKIRGGTRKINLIWDLIPDYEKCIMTWVDSSNGEVIWARELEPEECQLTLISGDIQNSSKVNYVEQPNNIIPMNPGSEDPEHLDDPHKDDDEFVLPQYTNADGGIDDF